MLLSALALSGCAPRALPTHRFEWVVGQGMPAFDPQGPPDAVRWALERQLSRGLTERDSLGRIVPAAADSIGFSSDSLTVTFRLRRGLRFTDGVACSSAAFERALEAGLARRDHSTASWLLGALVRPGAGRGTSTRPGRATAASPTHPAATAQARAIETPDARTLVLHLSHRDARLLEALALPGIGVPWRPADHAGAWGVGLGPYARRGTGDARWTLVRAAGPRPIHARAIVDTLEIRFAIGAPRVQTLLRAGGADLVWPLPPGLLALPPMPGYRVSAAAAIPERRLLLVMRADLPPVSRPAARHALAHGLNRGDLVQRLGLNGGEATAWLRGGERFEFPARSPEEIRDWLERGKFGRSLHVGMTYSADGAAGEVARGMQGEWARLGLDVELQPKRATAAVAHMLNPIGAHLLLVEHQALLDDPAAELAAYVMPSSGGPVGGLRTGWRTREFDPWIAPGARRNDLDVGYAERRLAEEDVVLPLARLRWVWMEREALGGEGFHPRFGPMGDAPRAPRPGRPGGSR